jgi:hypothetical protein
VLGKALAPRTSPLDKKNIPVSGLGEVEEEVGKEGDIETKEEEPRLGSPVPSVDVEHVWLQLVHDNTTSNVTGTTDDHTLTSDSRRRRFSNNGVYHRVSSPHMTVSRSRLTTTWTKGSLERDSDDDEHDSNTNRSAVAGNTADNTDNEHEETHQGDTSEIKGSTTNTTDNYH